MVSFASMLSVIGGENSDKPMKLWSVETQPFLLICTVRAVLAFGGVELLLSHPKLDG